MTTETPAKSKSSFFGLKALREIKRPKEPEASPAVPRKVKEYHRRSRPLRRVKVGNLSVFQGHQPAGYLFDVRGKINSATPTGFVREIHGRGRPAARGPEAMIARLATLGIRLAVAANGMPYALSEAGAMPDELRIQIAAAWPLLAGFLLGKPLKCAWCEEPATDLLLGGAPVCSRHCSEEIKP